jgi:hypothetical protein
MTKITALMELQPADRRKFLKTGNDQGRDVPPDRDTLMEQILDHLSTTPQEEMSEKVASLPDPRRIKVLDIRRQITKGSYEVVGRLDKVIDRILETITG